MLFTNKLKNGKASIGLAGMVAGLRQMMAMEPIEKNVSRLALATESISDSDIQRLSTVVESLGQNLQRLAQENQIEVTPQQMEAAQAAGVLATNPEDLLAVSAQTPAAGEGRAVVGLESVFDGFSKRSKAFEAYDESANRNAVVYSMAYNMSAARQDEFGETLFPTVTVTPDNVGFGVTIRLVSVFDDFKRDISGDLDRYNKVNIIRGIADPTVLKNELTRAIPVHRTESAKWFVAPTDVAPAAVMLDGESITTAPLLFGRKFSLIALSQTDALLANGAMDASDSIDPGGLRLRNVYLKVGDNVLRFNTKDMALASFVAAPQGLHRQMNLNFTTDALLLNQDSRRADGSALDGALLAGVVTANQIVRLSVNVSGSINVETGDTQLMASTVSVVSVKNSDGEDLDMTAGAPATLVAAIEAGALIGYDLQAYRANQNRRQRGQLLDVQYFTQLYTVPFRAPITALKPVNNDSSAEAGDLAALITATQVRTSNAAVTQLLETANVLNAYIDSRDPGRGPDVLGVGRLLVKATYMAESIDMLTAVDSVKSHERAMDVQAVLVNKIRDMAFRLWRDSEYQAAANAMKGGIASTPTVIIATDPVLARYIMIDGDLRTAGASFAVKVVSTLDERMRGRIAVTFGDFEQVSEPNALHFGNMAWKPELTLVLPISRGGSVSKELTVQPAFLHVTNLPVLGFIEVTGLEEVIAAKVPMYTEIL
jgi:hypothetical protein